MKETGVIIFASLIISIALVFGLGFSILLVLMLLGD